MAKDDESSHNRLYDKLELVNISLSAIRTDTEVIKVKLSTIESDYSEGISERANIIKKIAELSGFKAKLKVYMSLGAAVAVALSGLLNAYLISKFA